MYKLSDDLPLRKNVVVYVSRDFQPEGKYAITSKGSKVRVDDEELVPASASQIQSILDLDKKLDDHD